MKTTIKTLAFFLISFSTLGSEVCSLQMKKVISLDTEKVHPSCASNISKELKYSVQTWQECYSMALSYAEKNRSSISFTGSVGTLGGLHSCPSVFGNITEDVFVEWEYNDGLLFNSNGKITKFSDNYTAIDKGDKAYDRNGQKLFDD